LNGLFQARGREVLLDFAQVGPSMISQKRIGSRYLPNTLTISLVISPTLA
jgi:hypothetical protein